MVFVKNTCFLLFILLLISFGCVANQNTEGTKEVQDNSVAKGSEPEEKTTEPTEYAGSAFKRNEVSLCNVVKDSEIEEMFGLESDKLSHTTAYLPLSTVTSSACTYELLEPDAATIKTKYGVYTNDEFYDSTFESLLNESISNGKLGEYDYIYYEGVLSKYNFIIKIPEEKVFIEISASENFPGINEKKLHDIGALLVSRIDVSVDKVNELTAPSKEMLTYTGENLAFEYPSNWEVDKQYTYTSLQDKVSVKDPDGTFFILIGTGDNVGSDNSKVFQEMVETTPGILHNSKNEDEKIKKYTIIAKDKDKISVLQFGSLYDQKSLFVASNKLTQEEYDLYEDAIKSILDSVRAK